MNRDTAIVLIIAALALFVWVPAILWSVRRVLKKRNENNAE